MKTLLAVSIGIVALLAAGLSMAQSGGMMNGGMGGSGWMGGYGGIWVPILVVVVVVALVAWVVKKKEK